MAVMKKREIPLGVSPSDNATITSGFALFTTWMKSLAETLNLLLFDHTDTVLASLYPLRDRVSGSDVVRRIGDFGIPMNAARPEKIHL